MTIASFTGKWHKKIGSTGKIVNVDDTNLVLGVVNNATKSGSEVIWEKLNKEYNGGQIWQIGSQDDNGCFIIRNPVSGKLLYANISGKLTIEGMLPICNCPTYNICISIAEGDVRCNSNFLYFLFLFTIRSSLLLCDPSRNTIFSWF